MPSPNLLDIQSTVTVVLAPANSTAAQAQVATIKSLLPPGTTVGSISMTSTSADTDPSVIASKLSVPASAVSISAGRRRLLANTTFVVVVTPDQLLAVAQTLFSNFTAPSVSVVFIVTSPQAVDSGALTQLLRDHGISATVAVDVTMPYLEPGHPHSTKASMVSTIVVGAVLGTALIAVGAMLIIMTSENRHSMREHNKRRKHYRFGTMHI